jgi:peptidoglycan/xylan/chitin deacetylase (PgdA/CDA1 family)
MRAVLTFHHLGDDPEPVAYPARAFEALLRALDDRGLPIVDLDGLLAPGAGPGVALAFDDGWRSVLTEALPMLRAARAPAHLFLCTGLLAAESDVRAPMPRYARLDWDGVDRLRHGGVAVESHTHTHPDLRGGGTARVEEECARADELIERRTGRRPRYFAYPYGRCDAASRGVAASRYAAAFTTRLAPLSASDDRYRLPRIDAHYLRSDGARRRLGRPASRAWLAMRGALRTLGGRQ